MDEEQKLAKAANRADWIVGISSLIIAVVLKYTGVL